MDTRPGAEAWWGSANRAGAPRSGRPRALPECRRWRWRRPGATLEPALRRVELGAVGRQRDLRDAVGPADLAAGVAAAVVEHEPDFVGAGVLAHLLQEALEAEPVDVRQEQHQAGPADRLDRGIEPEPMVLVLMGPGRAAAERAPQPTVRDLEAEPGLVHGEHPL